MQQARSREPLSWLCGLPYLIDCELFQTIGHLMGCSFPDFDVCGRLSHGRKAMTTRRCGVLSCLARTSTLNTVSAAPPSSSSEADRPGQTALMHRILQPSYQSCGIWDCSEIQVVQAASDAAGQDGCRHRTCCLSSKPGRAPRRDVVNSQHARSSCKIDLQAAASAEPTAAGLKRMAQPPNRTGWSAAVYSCPWPETSGRKSGTALVRAASTQLAAQASVTSK